MITLQSPKVYSLPFSRKNRSHTFNNLICIKPMGSGFFFQNEATTTNVPSLFHERFFALKFSCNSSKFLLLNCFNAMA